MANEQKEELREMGKSKIQSQSVLGGTLILLIANLAVKIIGAGFKIPLTNLIGDHGMGYFNSGYSVYAGVFIIATAGLPVAVSRMVSESMALGRLKETKRIFFIAYLIFIVIGILGSCVLFFGARQIEAITDLPGTYMVIQAIAPALLFVSLMSVYRGFFQGMSNMAPTAVSEVVEALGKLVVGYLLAYLLLGISDQVAATGAVTGVTFGTFAGFIVLMSIYMKKKKDIYADMDKEQTIRSRRKILWDMVKIAIPITISASVLTLTNLTDLALVGNRLASIEHLLSEDRVTLYGRYTAKAVTMYNMPPTLVMSLCLALVPAVARAYTLGDKRQVKSTAEQALKMTILFGTPCAVGMAVLAPPILQLMFATTDATLLLRLVCPAILFVSMVLVCNSLLQATGNVWIPVVNIFIAGVAKIAVNWILIGIPSVNINGAPIGTSVCYFIYMSLNLFYVIKITKANPLKGLLRIAVSVAVMGAVAWGVYWVGSLLLTGTGRIETGIKLVAAIGVGALVYGMMLLAMGTITKEEIGVLPKGEKIVRLLQKMKLLRG
ncbi:MAG: polysaccharide biosynthesis protein [Clostridia bacterium]|nr:polysaccharide biosynthesis protein [Clostridia bacterium]